jgi:hypothetical protein
MPIAVSGTHPPADHHHHEDLHPSRRNCVPRRLRHKPQYQCNSDQNPSILLPKPSLLLPKLSLPPSSPRKRITIVCLRLLPLYPPPTPGPDTLSNVRWRRLLSLHRHLLSRRSKLCTSRGNLLSSRSRLSCRQHLLRRSWMYSPRRHMLSQRGMSCRILLLWS